MLGEESKHLFDEQATCVDIMDYLQMILTNPEIQPYLNFEVWGDKVVILISFDGVEITPTRGIELGLIGILNMIRFNTRYVCLLLYMCCVFHVYVCYM